MKDGIQSAVRIERIDIAMRSSTIVNPLEVLIGYCIN
jgi:hypothetical protein